ncbi:MAG: hypothetical protein ACRCZD_05285 [Phycicoccus sp.]
MPITATTSAGGRHDLLIMRIDDPQYGGAAPASVQNGPYTRFTTVNGVPNGSTTVPGANYPHIVLARIELPASTATVQAVHIIDLRKVARPQRERDTYNTQPASTHSITATTYADWHASVNRSIVVPPWASQVKVNGNLAGIVCRNSSIVGGVRALLGSLVGQEVAFDMDVNTRQTLFVSDTFAIPAALRGTAQTLKLQAKRTGGTGTIQIDSFSTILWDVEFLEVASAD